MNKIGVIIDSFKLDIWDGIKKAREVGAEGIQIYAVEGRMDPDNLSREQRRELLDFIKGNGLVVSALCADMGGGFVNPADNKYKIEKSKKIMELARDLGTQIVTTHIGVVPEDETSPRYRILQEACEELGSFADQTGAYFAIETGPEKSATLAKFIKSLSCRGIRVNLDPANLVMVTGDDPVQAVYNLKDYIVHTHAKDGVMISRSNPEEIYHSKPGHIIVWNEYFIEKPLGKGSVDFDAYLGALRETGYGGFLTIEREVGDDPEKDIRDAVDFLKHKLSRQTES